MYVIIVNEWKMITAGCTELMTPDFHIKPGGGGATRLIFSQIETADERAC